MRVFLSTCQRSCERQYWVEISREMGGVCAALCGGCGGSGMAWCLWCVLRGVCTGSRQASRQTDRFAVCDEFRKSVAKWSHEELNLIMLNSSCVHVPWFSKKSSTFMTCGCCGVVWCCIEMWWCGWCCAPEVLWCVLVVLCVKNAAKTERQRQNTKPHKTAPQHTTQHRTPHHQQHPPQSTSTKTQTQTQSEAFLFWSTWDFCSCGELTKSNLFLDVCRVFWLI